jgi:hypothetical protein
LPLSFFFFLKVKIWIICLFFFLDMIFNLNFWKLVPTTFFRRRRMINPSRWWK